MLLAVFAQAEGLSAKDSEKELRQDSAHQASPCADPMPSSLYPKVARKVVAPRRAQGLECFVDQASLSKVVVFGTIDGLLAHFVLSPLLRRILGRQASGGRAGHAEEAASRTGHASPQESHHRDDHTEGGKRAIAGSLTFAVLAAALAALGASKARPRRSTRNRGPSVVMTKASSEESDLSTTSDSTPARSSDGSRPSTDSDDESEIEDQKKAQAVQQRQTVGGGPCENPDPTHCQQFRAPANAQAVQRRQTVGGALCENPDPTHCQQFRAAENAQAVQQRRQTVGGGLCGNPDDFLTAPEVRLGSDGYVRQRTAEYERRIDFRKSLSENPPPLEEEEEEKEEESNRSSAAAGTALRRMGAEA